MSFRLRAPDVTRLVREIGSTNQGILGRILSAASPLLSPSDGAALTTSVNQAADTALRLDTGMTNYFKALDFMLEEMRDGKPIGTYPQQARILPATRTLPSWLQVEIAWEEAQLQLSTLLNHLKMVRERMRGLSEGCLLYTSPSPRD